MTRRQNMTTCTVARWWHMQKSHSHGDPRVGKGHLFRCMTFDTKFLLQVLGSYINPGGHIPKDFSITDGKDEEGSAHSTYTPPSEKWLLPEIVAELLSQSCLIPAISSYLRNDSVLDMARHVPLYRALLQLLRGERQREGGRTERERERRHVYSCRSLPHLLITEGERKRECYCVYELLTWLSLSSIAGENREVECVCVCTCACTYICEHLIH